MTEYLRIGKITTHHGIKGEMKVYATTDDIRRYDALKICYIDDNQYELENVKYVKNAPIIKLKGINSIEDTEKYVGKDIYVRREDGIKLLENEYYISDLIELDVYESDRLIGKVVDIMKTKAGAILVINVDKKEKLVPLVYEFVKEIDLINKKIKISTIEGLL